MENNIETFKNEKKVIIGRYSLLVGMLLMSIIPPISSSYNSLLALYHSILDAYQSYFNGLVSSFIFIFFLLANYIFGALISAKFVKILELKEEFLVIKMFDIIKSKIFQISYLDISKLEYSQDQFKNFIFTIKNGEQKIIRADIVDKEKAFELIQEKIANSRK